MIDDDSSNRDILHGRLEQAGHVVTDATNGEEGLRKLAEAPFDLVLLDVMMPRIDGWNVCRQIKTNPETKSIPVVLLTALDRQIDQLRGWECGADEYMTKPWEPAKLLECIKRLCPIAERHDS